MQIVGVEFSAPGACNYSRLAEVWKYSAQKAHPEATVKLKCISPPANRTTHQKRNQHKLVEWNKVIQAATEDTVLMDVDMVVYHDIGDVFDKDFDVCYTRRTATRMPLNGGVLFVKPTKEAKDFFTQWLKIDAELLQKRGKYSPYIRKYGGQNQASFGWMLEKGKYDAKIAHVDCTWYNCCNEEWETINGETRVVHHKGALKRICSRSGDYKAYHPKYETALKKWKAIEREMLESKGIDADAAVTKGDQEWQSKEKKQRKARPRSRSRR